MEALCWRRCFLHRRGRFISQWKMQLSWLGNCSSQHFLKLARAACEPGAQMLHCFLV